jgi:O-antigen biosynthesis protein
LAILEGDDYWTYAKKLATQMAFLADNPDTSMVFSKIELHDIETGRRRFLKRQETLTKSKLTAEDFLGSETMNLIANFSSCMFRKSIMTSLPADVFEPRFNEIALAFWLDHRHGPIGYIDKPMSVYQVHAEGTWTGDTRRSQLETGLAIRQAVKRLAAPRYQAAIQKVIDEQYLPELSALGSASDPVQE